MSDIREIVASINKKHGANTIGFAKDLGYTDIQRLPSGSLFLDSVLGKNKTTGEAGWPVGRLVELYGPESSGKSLICLKTIAEAQKKGYDCLYIDAENTFDTEFAQTLGVDTAKLILTREDKLGAALDLVCNVVENENVKVVIVDSLASLIPEVEVEAELEANQMAAAARMMSKGLRKMLHFNKNNTLVIFINQLRLNPGAGMYANPEYTPGGNALKYYSSIRVDVRRGDFLFEEGDKKKKIGQTVKFRIVKNKTDRPFTEGYFKYMYSGELDAVDELVSLGRLHDIIEQKGAYFYIGDKTFQGREKMEEALKNDPKFFEEVQNEVFGRNK